MGPTTVFTDRFWDHIEGWEPPGVGTVPGSEKPYFGPIPPPTVGPLVGTEGQWINGLDYDTWIGGGYRALNGCAPLVTDCAYCPRGSYPTVYLLSGGWGPPGNPNAAALNATFALRYRGNCLWQSDPVHLPAIGGTFTWNWAKGPGNGARLALNRAGPNQLWAVKQTTWDCLSSVWFPVITTVSNPLSQSGLVLISTSPYGDGDMIPPGTVISGGWSAPPAGYVACDGADYPTSFPYDSLFAAIGQTWNTFRGQVDPGPGRFRVPLAAGLVFGCAGPAVAAAGGNPATSARAVADCDGEEAHQLATAELSGHAHGITDTGHAHGITDTGHAHGITDTGHTHSLITARNIVDDASPGVFAEQASINPVGSSTGLNSATTGVAVNSATTGVAVNSATTGVAVNSAGGDQPHNNIQPTGWFLYAIKL